jgi:hypothetical protein
MEFRIFTNLYGRAESEIDDEGTTPPVRPTHASRMKRGEVRSTEVRPQPKGASVNFGPEWYAG